MTTTMTERVYNFSPGPAVLPEPVLRTIRDELFSLRGSGMSILEVSHREPIFLDILGEATSRLTELLGIPKDYRVLFVQGGSRLQFSMIPMNLAGPRAKCSYIVTGTWGKAAYDEARKLSVPELSWDGKSSNYSTLPQPRDLSLSADSSFVHFTSNETIQGVQFPEEPSVGSLPLVCDASSDFLSRPIPVAKYGLIYACAQKNAGPAGVTVVIIREDLLKRSGPSLPSYLSFQNHASENSLFNTAPTFGIYVVSLVAEWLLNEMGGLSGMQVTNQRKARLLYEVIDSSEGFYQGHAAPECRSLMNVTFRLPSDELQQRFLQEAEAQDLMCLKGHRSVGGIRASIYNAMPEQGVERLRDHMREFLSRWRGKALG